jgi:glycosyltransferase involved in cell wall biosynthesis
MRAAARRVLVVQRRMTHYRVDFFEHLRRELPRHGVELVLAYGEPTPAEAAKRDGAELPWAHPLRTRYLLGTKLCWQPFAQVMSDCDAVVLTPENKLLNNLGAQFLQRRCKVVFWGHGANLQARRLTLAERYKRWLARHVDWWLAYTDHSRPLIARSGFPDDRITVLNNAVDTVRLAQQFAVARDPARMAASRRRFGIEGQRVGTYVGSLFADKRPAMLLDAAQAIRERVPDFELLVCGDGTDAPKVREFCRAHPWAHYAGVVKGQDKADALAISRVLLCPGAVGLGVLDSFACALPLVTTDCGLHGPEIAYITNGVNGVLSADDTGAFVDAAVHLLVDDAAHARLVERCAASAGEYTVERMAQNFARGVVSCLEAPPWR